MKIIPTTFSLVVLGIATFILNVSCKAIMLDSASLAQAKDATAPELVILSPADGSECANIVEVSGRVTDAVNDGGKGRVSSLVYEIPGSLVSGSSLPDSEGNFLFQFKADSLGTSFSLRITATDWNDNSSIQGINLVRNSVSSIPSFKAVPSNRKVSLSWDAVPETESYTIYYTTNGTLPSESSGFSITQALPPYELSGVENGLLYTFRVKAVAKTGWVDSQSGFIRTIPLSSQTLIPVVSSGRGEVSLTWNEIPATNVFELQRRVGETGDYSFYRLVTGNSYVDTGLANGEHYYYRIRPAEDSEVVSGPAVGVTDGFERGANVTKLGSIIPSWATLAWREDLLFASGYTGVQILLPALGYYELAKISATVVRATAAPVGSNELYLAAGEDGLLIYNAQLPASPYLRGSFRPEGIDARTVAIHANPETGIPALAYVADYCRNIYCLDISNPDLPVLLKTFPLDDTDRGSAASDNSIFDIVLSPDGQWLYVGGRSGGVQVINTAAPDGTVAVEYQVIHPDNGQAFPVYGLTLQDQRLYAGAEQIGLLVFDLTNPAVPVELGRTPWYSTNIRDVEVRGSSAFVSNWASGVSIIDISIPEQPTLKQTFSLLTGYGGMGTHSIAIKNGAAFAWHHADWNDTGIYMVDLNMPVEITQSSTLSFPEAPLGIAFAGPYAYVAAGYSGLRILDISNPVAITELSHALTALEAGKVALAGDYAFVAERGTKSGVDFGWGNVEVFDISQPSNPKRLASFDTGSSTLSGWVKDLVVSGDYAYVLVNYSGLEIYDVSEPSKPVYIEKIVLPFMAQRISLRGRYALVSDWSGSLLIVDVGDPYRPALVKSIYEQYSSIEDYTMSGNLALNSLGFDGFLLRNMTNPATTLVYPEVKLAFEDAGGNPNEFVDTAGGLGKYIALGSRDLNTGTHWGHLRIYDVSDLSSLKLVDHLSTGSYETESTEANHFIAFAGPVIYVGGVDGRLRVFNMRPN